MDRTKILDETQGIFRDIFNDPQISIGRQTNANDIESWDSLNHMVLIVAVEQKFRIKFGLGEIHSFKNVGDLLDLIEKKVV